MGTPKWKSAIGISDGVRWWLGQLPQAAHGKKLDILPFRDVERKILIFEDVELIKSCGEYAETLLDNKSVRIIREHGYHPPLALITMRAETWLIFQQEQAGNWRVCQSLDEFKTICQEMQDKVMQLLHRQTQNPAPE